MRNFLNHLKDEVDLAKNQKPKIENSQRQFRVFDGPPRKRDFDPFKNQNIEINLRRGLTGIFVIVISSAAYLHFVKTRYAS